MKNMAHLYDTSYTSLIKENWVILFLSSLIELIKSEYFTIGKVWTHLTGMCAVGGLQSGTLKSSPVLFETILRHSDIQEVS